MHLRKLVLACGFASFALSNYASALGLGEVKLKSTLNQPLSAEVQLLDTKGLSPEQIIVSLASASDFERNGLDFVHFYSEFRFEVALDNPSGPIVRITSRNPVREPYLNFLVEAKWTSGRLLREYTLLMDLPTFDKAAPQAVQAAKAAPAKSETVAPAAKKAEVALPSTQTPAAAVEEKPEIIAEQDQPAKKSKVASGTYGPVGGKDTLWDIALAVRPDSSASVHQTMLALQRLNPDAFIRGNINLLKKGQVLRVPDATEISSVSQSEAVRQFNAQTAEWSGGGTSTTSTALGAQLDASRRTSGERAKSEAVAGRVKLEAPSTKDTKVSGQASGSNKGSGKALESELAATLEELDKAKSEKTELSSRVHDLEDQVKTMQRLVDVSNEKLRALQLNASKQPDKASADKTQKPADVKTPATVVSSASQTKSSAAAVAEAASSATASVAPKKPAVKPPVQPVVPEKTIVDQLFDNIALVGLGVAGVLGLAGFAVWRRRKSQDEGVKATDNTEDMFASEPNFDSFNQSQPDDAELDLSADEMSLFDEEDSTTVAETGDVVGEADIYIAYGKFDQAEEMLVNGLAKDPASTDIRLKLLEVYSQTQNVAEFDKHYAAMLPLATGFALSRAKELRANIPGISEFSAEAPQSQEEETLDFNEGFSLDDFDAEPSKTETSKDSSEDFNFDLDLDDSSDLELNTSSASNYGMDFNEKADAAKGAVASLDDDFVLDFDLEDSVGNDGAAAEDLSEITLALDSLDDDGLPDDIEVSSSAHEDEFSFDFDELDNEPSSLAQEVDSIKSSELNLDETSGDDFNLDMDVSTSDLAALDSEMASLDAELDSLDAEDGLNAPAPLSNLTIPDADVDDFDIGSLDDELAGLDANLASEEFDVEDDDLDFSVELEDESLADLEDSADADLDESEFSWEEPEEDVVESAGTLEVADDDLSLDEEDEFDIDAPLDESDSSLQDLDASLATEEVVENLDAEVSSFAEIDNELDDVALEEISLDDDQMEADLAAEVAEVSDEVVESSEPDVAFNEAAPLMNDSEEDLSDDDVFDQALSDFSAESLALDDASDMSDDDMDAELDFMADADEAATKLDLARAYMDMGDNEGARDILAEVAHEGNDEQRQEAVDLLSRIDA